ncbi:cytochrome c oxidase assembly protein [Shumkonia mesophila]|uniref:cytochrome c oxidase assembly protein n=1 Tax=Shumkonia mesophila TaxID=2838854 RepID=UPI0029348675|nr:cytochrome c oxidase assembly protein [Shumkonia mesophila]
MDASDRQIRARRGRRVTALALVGVVAGMTGLAFASVPLYRLFCQVTGYGGTPRVALDGQAGGTDGTGRSITVRFDANVNPPLPWRFRPEQHRVQVPLGESTLAVYRAENLSDAPITGTATFNVTPNKAAPYFVKVQCFCFSEQRLEAHGGADLPVSFYVDPAIAEDPDTRDVSTITLSYTFFRAATDPSRSAAGLSRPAATTAAGAPNG